MVAVNQIRDEYRLEATAVGVEQTKSAAEGLAAATDKLTTSSEKQERKVISVQRALEKFAAANDQAFRAQQQVERAQALVNRAFEQGLGETLAYQRATVALAEKQAALARITAQAGAANDNNAAALARMRAQYDPIFAAQLRHRTALEGIAEAEKAGAITATTAMQARIAATRVMEDQASKLERLAQTQKAAAQRQVNQQLIVPDRGADIAAYAAEMDRLRAKFDPLFAAQTAYRSGLAELRQALATGAISEAAYTAELDRRKAAFAEQVRGLGLVSAAERAAAAAAQETVRATQAAANAAAAAAAKARAQGIVSGQTITVDRGADVAAYGQQLDTLRAKYNPLFAAGQAYKAQLIEIGQAAKVGAISEAERAAAITRTKDAFARQVDSIRNNSGAVAINANQWTNLGYQINDVFTSLSSGASPMMVLTQQGGQIYQALDGPKGVTGGLKEVGNFLLGLLTPARLAVGGLAALGVTAIAAAMSWRSTQAEVRQALAGVGRAAGVTVGELEGIAVASAAASNSSVGAARSLALELAKTGKIARDNLAPIAALGKNFAATLGLDATEGNAQLARSFAEPGKGAEDLARRYGLLSDATVRYIQQLEDSNERGRAQQALIDALRPKLVNAAELTTGWAYAWDKVSTAARNAWDWIGKATDKAMGGTGGGSDEEIRKALEERLRYQQSAAGRAASSRGGDLEASNRAIAETQRQLAALEQRTAKVRTDAQDAAKNDLSLRAGLIARAVAPELQALDELRAKRKTLADDMANQGAGPGVKDQAVALARLDAQIRDFTEAGGALELQERKRAAASQIVLDALKARTPAEVGAIAARKALNDAEGTATFQAERTAQAERERTQAAAAAQKALDDQSGAVQRNTEGNGRVADAWRVSSEAGALYAESVRKASEDVETRGLPADRKLAQQQAYLREQLSEQIKERARAIAQKNQEVSVDENLARLVDKQVVSHEQAAQQRQRDLDVARLQGLAAVAEGDQRTALLRQIDDLTAAYSRENTVRAERAAQGMIADQERELAQLRLEAELVGKSTIERERAVAVLRAQQELQRQGIALSSEKGQTYIDNAAMLSDIRTARTQFERLAQDVSSVVSGIFDDMFKAGNKGLAGFFDSFARGFARIGTRILEQNLIAPLVTSAMGGGSGAGGVGANIFGNFDFGKIEKAVSEGSFSGIMESFGDLLKPGAGSKGGGFASSKLGGGLLSAGVGASIGYQSQSPLVGALGGAASGFAMGGPVGGVVGGIAGLLGGLFGKSQAKKEAHKKLREQLEAYKEAYRQAEPEIKKLQATFRGESLGNVGGQIDDAFQQAYQANKTASQAGDQPRADQIMRDFEAYADRLRWQFIYAFEGTLKEVSAGFGTSGPFAQANAAVASLGESLKAFVADAMKLPEPEKNGPRARAAAQQAALAALDPPKALSDTQSRLAAIQGTASGLTTVLKDLGMSANEAATAIRDRTAAAMKALRAEFSADLKAKTNEATGKGYLNEAADLVKERDALLADAKAIGAGTADVSAYFRAAAQKIVDGSELTGDAFTALVRQFPALRGAVVEFGKAVDSTAAKAAAAARATGYADRLFAAGNDTSTLAGALAAQERKAAADRLAEQAAGGQKMKELEKALGAETAAIRKQFAEQALAAETAAREAGARRTLSAEDRIFAARNDASTLTGKLAEIDRQHAQERVEEVAAGGQALAKLEAAQAAERLKIVREAGEAEVAARKQALAEAQTFLDGAVKNIRTYLDGLKTGADTALSPGDRLAEAQSQFDRQIGLARSGNRDALGSITTYASSLLDAGRANYASGEGYQSILAAVQQSLGDLPSQVSAEQFIVDAIAKSTTDLGKAIAANSPTAIASALDGNFGKLDTNLDGKLSSAEFLAGLGPLATVAEQQAAKAVFDRIDQNGDGFIDALERARFDLVAAVQANSPSLIQQALSSEFDKLDMDGSGGLTESEFLAGLGPLATAAEQAAARAYFKAIDEDGNGIIDRVELMRGQLKTAVEANSPGAIELALRTNFDKLDTTANGLLDKGELLAGLGPLATAQQQADALAVFKRIDEDGDGQISKQELIRSQLKAAIEANSPTLIQKALSLDFAKLDKLDANTKGSLTIAEFKSGLGPLATQAEQDAAELLFKSMDENGDGLLSATELMRGQLKTAIEANSPSGIASALKGQFDKLDTTMDGRLSKAEFIAGLGPLATKGEQEAARAIFSAIDANGDGLITRTELMHAELKAAIGSNSPTAINAAIKANFDRLDTTMNGRLSQAELLAGLGPLATKAEQQAAKAIFNEIDLNGDGLLTKTELMRTDLRAAIEANSPGLIQKALSLDFSRLDTNTKGALTIAEFKSGLGPLATKAEQDAAERLFEAIDANGDGLLDKTELMRGQLVTALTTNSPANIAAALNANFSKLDTTMNGRLSQVEFLAGLGPLATKAEQDAAKKIFQSIDADGDGQISKLELVRSQLKAAIEANSPALIQKALSLDFAKLDAVNANTKGALTIAEFKAGLGPLATKAEQDAAELLFQSMDANGDGMLSALELMRGQLVAGLQANSPALIASALSANFAMLDTSVNGLLDYKEFTAGLGPLATKKEQEDARKLFESIDANGDGQISAQELARVQLKAAIEANSPALIQKALSLDFAKLDKIDTNTRGALTVAEFKAGLGPLATKAEQDAAELLFQAIDANGDGLLDKTELMRGQLKSALEANSPAAIATALNTNFTKLDTTMNGRLTKAEFLAGLGPLASAQQQADAIKLFKSIDENGDGQITKQELIRSQLKAAIEANSPALIQKALSLDFEKLDKIDVNTKGSLTIAEFKAGLGPLATKAEQDVAELLFKSMDENGDAMLDITELMRGQLKTAIEANSPSLLAAALKTNFDKLDATMNGRLDEAEFLKGIGALATKEQADAAKKVFDAIDKDGDGQISKLEAVLAELKANLGSPTAIATALNDNFKMLDRTSDKAIDLAEFTAAIGPLATKADQQAAKAVFDSIDADGDKLIDKMELTRSDLQTAIKANSASAIATALTKNFDTLASKTSGGITKAQFDLSIAGLATKTEQAAAYKVFQAIDADGNGIITKTEAVRAELLAQLKLNDPSKIASALNANFSTLTAATNGRLTRAQLIAGLGPLATKADQATALKVFQSIDADGNNIVTKLEAVSGAIVAAVKANNATAFATEIDKSFTDLDTRVDGLLDKTELAAAIKGLSTDAEIKKANDWLRLIDTDNDGMLSKTEVIRARMVDVNANTGATKTAVDQSKTEIKAGNKTAESISAYTFYTRKATEATQSLIATLNNYQKSSESRLKTSNETLATLKDTGGLQKQQLEALNAQFASSPFTAPNGVKVDSNMIQALNKIVFNTANTVIGQKTGASYAFASGGWVNGPGTGTSDSISTMLSNGEFVVNAASARLYGRQLEMMNAGIAPQVSAVPVPMPVANDNAALVAGMQRQIALLTRTVALLEQQLRLTKDGADRQVRATEGVREEVAEHRDDDKRRERKGTGVAGGRGAQAA